MVLPEIFISFSATYTCWEHYMAHLVFRAVISSAGKDKYGEKRYAIYIPKSLRDKAESMAGKEVIVIVLLPDDS
jgi:hypothetical protein